MGQLEKYGLYVLCLVIFLILGVAIWGGDPTVPQQPGKEVSKLAAIDAGKGKDLPREQPRDAFKDAQGKDATKEPGKPQPAEAGKGAGENLGTLLAPHPRTGEQKKDASKDPGTKAAADAVGGKPTPEGDKAGVPPAAKVVADQKPRLYVVKDHDSLFRIAERELGSASRLHEIESLNPAIKDGRIKKGDQIKLPPAKAHEDKGTAPAVAKLDGAAKPDAKHENADKGAPKATPAAGSSYKVRHGDTLTSISRAAYGNEKHVRAILAANVGKVASANSLKENTVLALPARP